MPTKFTLTVPHESLTIVLNQISHCLIAPESQSLLLTVQRLTSIPVLFSDGTDGSDTG